MNQEKLDHTLLLIIRIGAFLCFAGWTWVHFYWEGPYGILFWQDDTFAFANWLGISWEKFVGSGADDGFVQRWVAGMSWLYLVCTILTLTVRKKSWFQMAALVGGSGLLLILSYAKYLSSRNQLPMFIEHGGQMLMPVILVLALSLGVRHRLTVATAIFGFITTFAGHGSYAVGLWPTPGNFYAMTSVILHVDYPIAKAIIHAAGALDFVACIGLFIPFLRRPSAMYGVVWGFLTAIARPMAGMSLSLNYWGADQFLHEAVLRAPHFLIPLYLYILWHKPRESEVRKPAPQAEQTGSTDMPLIAHSFLPTNPKPPITKPYEI